MVLTRHKKFQRFASRWGNTFAYGIVVLASVAGLKGLQIRSENKLEAQADQTAQILYDNSLAACDRGNKIRAVVYANTRQAARLQPEVSYADQLKELRDTPFINLKDGTIDCLAAIPRP